jgi:hypothetical protein
VSTQVPTRLAGLQWLLVLHATLAADVAASLDELFPVLLKTLCDPAEEARPHLVSTGQLLFPNYAWMEAA